MDGPVIEVRGLVKEFAAVRALDELSLDVERGTVHGLLGPNGAGKTTLIRVLTTLLAHDAGTARVAGVDVRRDPGRVRSRIGLAGQAAAVDDHLTGRENVEMIGQLYGLRPTERRRRANEVVERIRLAEVADRPVKSSSGGMRRRLDLAASLVGRPEVLFLDEPTTGLDPASRRDVWDMVRGLVDVGSTVLLTTQYLGEADELADRITVVDSGRVVGNGTPDELKDTVGGATVELDVADADSERALDALRGLAARAGGGTIRLPAERGVDTLREVLRCLDDHRITPEDITLRNPSLDDVFLALTGHATTDPATTNGKAAR